MTRRPGHLRERFGKADWRLQVYFHRPIHELFSTFFKTGLVMDRIEEPGFTAEDATPDRLLSTANFVQLPPILGFRLRMQ